MEDNLNSPIEYLASHYYNMNLSQFATCLDFNKSALYKAAKRKSKFKDMKINLILSIKNYDRLTPIETIVARMIVSQRTTIGG